VFCSKEVRKFFFFSQDYVPATEEKGIRTRQNFFSEKLPPSSSNLSAGALLLKLFEKKSTKR